MIVLITTSVYLVSIAFGQGILGNLGINSQCYKYLGCNLGFFGYDAIEHFLFGVAIVWVLVWFFQKYPKFSLFDNKRWKNIFIIITLIALISVVWALLKFTHDAIRINILHQTLVNWKLHINFLDQPSNANTMGDFFFNLFGAVISLFFVKL